MTDIIYFDNAATTKICDEALEVYDKYARVVYYNPSAAYTPAVKIERSVFDAENTIVKLLGATKGKVIFTSGGTEGDNMAILGSAEKSRKNHIITSSIEHPAVLKTCLYLRDKKGYELTILPVDSNGHVCSHDLEKAITSQTFLITIMHVNNETGTIQDIKELCRTAKYIDKDILFHSDGVQAFGKIDIDIDDLGIDMYTISSHKIHGPKGVGALYLKNENKINPISYGGGQQNDFRSGTYNHSGILAFEKAAKLFRYDAVKQGKIKNIKQYLAENLKKNISDTLIISQGNNRFNSNILSVAFKNINAETLLHSAQYEGLLISTGSACSARHNIVSSTLKAMKVDKDYIGGAIRISLSSYNTLDEAKRAVEIISQSVKKLRKYAK